MAASFFRSQAIEVAMLPSTCPICGHALALDAEQAPACPRCGHPGPLPSAPTRIVEEHATAIAKDETASSASGPATEREAGGSKALDLDTEQRGQVLEVQQWLQGWATAKMPLPADVEGSPP